MAYIIAIAAAIYLAGAIAVFAIHTQMPVTFGLAVARSAAWPISVALHDLWPRGQRLETDCDGPDCG